MPAIKPTTIKIPPEIAEYVEQYRQQRGLKSSSAALLELTGIGIEKVFNTTIRGRAWGGDRKSGDYRARQLAWMQNEIRNAMRHTGDWDEILLLGEDWREAYRLMGSPSDSDPAILAGLPPMVDEES